MTRNKLVSALLGWAAAVAATASPLTTSQTLKLATEATEPVLIDYKLQLGDGAGASQWSINALPEMLGPAAQLKWQGRGLAHHAGGSNSVPFTAGFPYYSEASMLDGMPGLSVFERPAQTTGTAADLANLLHAPRLELPVYYSAQLAGLSKKMDSMFSTVTVRSTAA